MEVVSEAATAGEVIADTALVVATVIEPAPMRGRNREKVRGSKELRLKKDSRL
jgi:hypothetical protein